MNVVLFQFVLLLLVVNPILRAHSGCACLLRHVQTLLRIRQVD